MQLIQACCHLVIFFLLTENALTVAPRSIRQSCQCCQNISTLPPAALHWMQIKALLNSRASPCDQAIICDGQNKLSDEPCTP